MLPKQSVYQIKSRYQAESVFIYNGLALKNQLKFIVLTGKFKSVMKNNVSYLSSH